MIIIKSSVVVIVVVVVAGRCSASQCVWATARRGWPSKRAIHHRADGQLLSARRARHWLGRPTIVIAGVLPAGARGESAWNAPVRAVCVAARPTHDDSRPCDHRPTDVIRVTKRRDATRRARTMCPTVVDVLSHSLTHSLTLATFSRSSPASSNATLLLLPICSEELLERRQLEKLGSTALRRVPDRHLSRTVVNSPTRLLVHSDDRRKLSWVSIHRARQTRAVDVVGKRSLAVVSRSDVKCVCD